MKGYQLKEAMKKSSFKKNPTLKMIRPTASIQPSPRSPELPSPHSPELPSVESPVQTHAAVSDSSDAECHTQ